jgi:cell division protein FtsI/penicillin-binding protein 2
MTDHQATSTVPDGFYTWTYLYAGILLLLFSVLVGRLYYLQIHKHQSYASQRSDQTEQVRKKDAPRGSIFDDRGRLLVASQLRMSVYADPGLVKTPEKTATALAQLLDVDKASLQEKLSREEDRFIWVKRRVTPSVAERVRQEEFRGVRFRREFDRRYPHGDLAAHVLGMVGSNRQGLGGVELQYDDALTGNPARFKYTRDGTGKLLYASAMQDQVRATGGSDMRLTINLTLQQIVEQELNRLTDKHSPNWASVVVINPSNGAVKALANRPTFEPGAYGNSTESERRNRAITDPVEPGSSLKPFVMAAALEEGLVTPESRIFCENGQWRYRTRLLHDYKSFGALSATEVISKSSNIGMAKIGVELGGQLRPWIKRFRFGEPTGIALPGEDPGVVQSPSDWNEIYTQTSVPMGHEILTTPLQVVNAFSVFANGGYLVQPKIIRKVGDERYVRERMTGKRVLDTSTVSKMRDMMRKVVTDGTGTAAQSDLIRIAGKTGTSKKYTDKAKYLSVFVGFAPVHDPELVVGGFVDEAEEGYAGGQVVGPMVRRIFERASQFRNMNLINSSRTSKK